MSSVTATTQRDLRTGTPVWLRRGDARVASSPLAEDLAVDVVGAGVSGALVVDAILRRARASPCSTAAGRSRARPRPARRCCSSRSTSR